VIKTHSRNKSICTFGFGKELLFVENWTKLQIFGFKVAKQPIKGKLIHIIACTSGNDNEIQKVV